MKNLKKLLAVVVAIAMITTFMVPSFAAEGSYTYENEAEILYKLGLYKGTSTTTYEPNLGGKLDRQTGVVMLLRLFGQEEEALQMDAADAAAKLAAKFKDAADIADWAQRQVAYAVEKGYVKGLPDGTFAPTADLNGKAFCSLILQQLGYDGDFTYDNAAFDLSKFGGLTEAQAQLFNSNAGINRDSMVGIAFSALQAVYKDSGKTVIEYLAEIGYVDKNLAIEVGVLKKEIKEVGALEDVKVTINETPVLPTEVEVTYVDDTTAKLPVTWPTVNTSEVGEQTIEGSIEGYKDVKATVKVIVQPAELLVDKISMNNLIEIVIDFNGEVESGKADEKKNYSVDGKTIDSVSVSEDKTSVTLLLTAPADQEEELEVTVKTAAGLTKDYTGKVTAIDNTLPEAKSIILTGPNSFEITFSEPIDAGVAEGDVIVDDGTYYVSSKELSADGKTLSVELGVSSLKEGTYKVKVRNYRDYANLIMVPKTFDLEYVKDTEAPTATVKKATQNEVEIEFNEPVVIDVDSSDLKNFFYHTYSSWKPAGVTTSDNKVFKLDFSNQYLQEGNVTITIVKEYDEVVIKDKWGNELQSDIKLTATVVADNEAPTVVKVEATAEDKIEITFSESVNRTQAENEDNYAIKKDGKEVEATISEIKYVSEDNKVEITLSEKLSGGKYTIDVKDIADTSISENKIKAITLEFEVTDKTAPVVEKVTYVGNLVYVKYNEPMKTSGTGSVLNKDNYRIFKGSTTAEISKIELFGSSKDKVKITVKNSESLDLDGYKLNVVRVEDEAGNAIDPFTRIEEELAVEQGPKVVAAKITSKTDIEITIDTIVDRGTVQREDFAVAKDGTTFAALTKITSIEFDDGKTIIKGKLDSNVQPDNSGAIVPAYKLKVANEFKSDTGQVVSTGVLNDLVIGDGWAPSLVENDPITVADDVYGVVLITFTEGLDSITDIAAADLVIVDKKGKTLVAGVDYTVELVDGSNEVLKVTLAGDYADYTGQIKISTAEKVRYIKDGAGNTIETFKDKKVTVGSTD